MFCVVGTSHNRSFEMSCVVGTSHNDAAVNTYRWFLHKNFQIKNVLKHNVTISLDGLSILLFQLYVCMYASGSRDSEPPID